MPFAHDTQHMDTPALQGILGRVQPQASDVRQVRLAANRCTAHRQTHAHHHTLPQRAGGPATWQPQLADGRQRQTAEAGADPNEGVRRLVGGSTYGDRRNGVRIGALQAEGVRRLLALPGVTVLWARIDCERAGRVHCGRGCSTRAVARVRVHTGAGAGAWVSRGLHARGLAAVSHSGALRRCAGWQRGVRHFLQSLALPASQIPPPRPRSEPLPTSGFAHLVCDLGRRLTSSLTSSCARVTLRPHVQRVQHHHLQQRCAHCRIEALLHRHLHVHTCAAMQLRGHSSIYTVKQVPVADEASGMSSAHTRAPPTRLRMPCSRQRTRAARTGTYARERSGYIPSAAAMPSYLRAHGRYPCQPLVGLAVRDLGHPPAGRARQLAQRRGVDGGLRNTMYIRSCAKCLCSVWCSGAAMRALNPRSCQQERPCHLTC